MDVKIKSEQCDFKMRVAGCLIKDDKLLTVQICDNGFYCLPGGHVHLGEDSLTAMIREFKEEVNITCDDAKLIAVIENFFLTKEKKKVQEVCYFYLMNTKEDIETKDYTYVENDEGIMRNLDFKWIDIEELHNADFRPTTLIDKLQKRNYELEHIIFDTSK